MSEEFIAKPFISHDGRDNKGVRAEVRVIIGRALVSEMKKPKNRSSSLVQFSFSSPVNKYPTSGWINKERDNELYELLKEAYDNEDVLSFRIEVQRKSTVERDIPFDEVSPPNDAAAAFENTFRHIVAARKEDDSEWVIGTNMITNFKEDSVALDNPHGAFKATDDDIFDTESDNAPVKETKSAPKGNSAYNVRSNDGSVNINSFALLSPAKMIFFLKEYINKNLGETPFTPEEERKIAAGLLSSASYVQKAISGDNFERADLGTYSHRFAEEVVQGVVENYMPLREFGEDSDFDDELNNYIKKVVLVSRKIAQWSIDTVDELDGKSI